jgi:hypothetical protein
MPCLSIRYNPSVGPLLQLAIWPSGYAPPNTPGAPPSHVSLYMALIDTGASHTCISAKVISDLTLSPMGKMPVGGVHGSQPANQYQFQVALIFPQSSTVPTASGAVAASVHVTPVTGIEFVPNGPFDVLLGRDVICQGSFSMSLDNHAIFCV